jgi:lysophospholipase L1-like esterase
MSFEQKWQGKTFVTLGDSITHQDGKPYMEGPEKGKIARGYQTILKESLGFSSYDNYGVSGRPIANGTVNGTGTNITAKTLSYHLYDLVIIAGGTNDFKLNVPMGDHLVLNTHTFYGAYQGLIEHILHNYSKQIVLLTPLERNKDGYDNHSFNKVGHQLKDYVDAIKELGEMYSLPVCDLYTNSGFTHETLSIYTWDGLHPNDVGYKKMAECICQFINKL